MNKEKVAQELLKVAQDLMHTRSLSVPSWLGADTKEVLSELDYFVVDMAEGLGSDNLTFRTPPTLKGKKFKKVRDLEKAVELFEYPDGGYDKVFIKLKMKDGSDLNFRYDHSKKGPSLSRQFDNYVKKVLKKGRKAQDVLSKSQVQRTRVGGRVSLTEDGKEFIKEVNRHLDDWTRNQKGLSGVRGETYQWFYYVGNETTTDSLELVGERRLRQLLDQHGVDNIDSLQKEMSENTRNTKKRLLKRAEGVQKAAAKFNIPKDSVNFGESPDGASVFVSVRFTNKLVFFSKDMVAGKLQILSYIQTYNQLKVLKDDGYVYVYENVSPSLHKNLSSLISRDNAVAANQLLDSWRHSSKKKASSRVADEISSFLTKLNSGNYRYVTMFPKRSKPGARPKYIDSPFPGLNDEEARRVIKEIKKVTKAADGLVLTFRGAQWVDTYVFTELPYNETSFANAKPVKRPKKKVWERAEEIKEMLTELGLRHLGSRSGKAGEQYGMPDGARRIAVGGRDFNINEFKVYIGDEHQLKRPQESWGLLDFELLSKITDKRIERVVAWVKRGPTMKQVRNIAREGWRDTGKSSWGTGGAKT